MPGACRLDCRNQRYPAFSCLYGQTMNVGRVMTPTLAIVVMRDVAIRAFKSEPFYSAELRFRDFQAGGERMKEKAEAEKLVAECCQAEIVRIMEKNIGFCRACDGCMRNGGTCVLKDDIPENAPLCGGGQSGLRDVQHRQSLQPERHGVVFQETGP